jgi:protein-disulfide isomerase
MSSERLKRNISLRSVLDSVAALFMIAASALLIWAILSPDWIGGARRATPARPTTPIPGEPQSLSGAAVAGSAQARLAVIQYSEFQCPYCRQFSESTLPRIKASYVDSGKLLFVFRHLPLEGIHPHALKAAEAAECAGAQGRFWEFHDALFRNQPALEAPRLPTYAQTVGLDVETFTTCLAGAMTEKVRGDARQAARLEIRQTPTFLFGTLEPDGRVRIVEVAHGAMGFDNMSAIIDRLLPRSHRTISETLTTNATGWGVLAFGLAR